MFSNGNSAERCSVGRGATASAPPREEAPIRSVRASFPSDVTGQEGPSGTSEGSPCSESQGFMGTDFWGPDTCLRRKRQQDAP